MSTLFCLHSSKRPLILISLILSCLFGIFPSPALSQTSKEWAEGRILVQPRAGLSEEKLAHILQQSNGKAKGKLGTLNIHVVEVPPQAEQAVARALSRNPHIQFAEVDGLATANFTPNDPTYPSQWHLPKIQAPQAWDSTQGQGVILAVLDTGIDPNHPDLADQLVNGWNVVSNNANTADWHGHGTSVAGVAAAATNNGLTVAGVAGQVSLMPMRINNSSGAYWSDMAAALNWAADHGARVANLSFGPLNNNTVTTAANYFRSKGGIVVTSASNDGTNPGISENPALVVVSATNQSDVRTSWSNYGDYVDVAAPGIDIYTTRNGGGTTIGWGTSYSAPLTAGVVALIMAQNPDLTPNEVEAVLEDSADDIGSSLYYGAGRVNAAQAVQMAGGTSGGTDTESPTVAISSPARDATVSGWVTVDVNATDNVGVTKVELYAGSQWVGEDTTAPYQFSWDSTTASDGTTTLIAYAYDAANNDASSGSHPVLVDNVPDPVDTIPPTVGFQQPSANSTVTGTVQITVQASDNVGLESVNLYIDEVLKSSGNVSPLAYSWNSRKVADGAHELKAVATDTAGLSTTTLIQVFKGSPKTLSTTISGAGSVTSSPSGLNCPSGTCTASFGNGSTVTLTATPNSGATFSGWGGACGGSATTCTVTMSADRSVTATFTTSSSPPPPSGGIQINFQPSGATVPNGYMADDGSPYSSSRGYGWTTNRTGSTRERNQQVDQRLDTLAFASPGETGVWHYDLPNGDYVVSLASGDPAYSHGPQRVEVEGTVVIDNLTSAKDAYLTVENVPVTIVDGTLTITLGGSSGYSLLNYLHVTPVAADSYTLSVAVSGSGSVTSSPSGLNCPSGTCTASFGNGSTVTLTATPNSGATFSGWGGACGGSATTCTVTMSADRSVTATFTTSSSPPPPSGGIQINFQPSGATVPNGYMADDGSPYSSSRGYGWTTNRTGSTRERNQQVDQRLDTLAFASPGETGVWHYDLPNGDYVVSLASGDPAYSHGPQRVEVEGTVVIDNLTSAKDAYLTVENVPVTIVDGTLTITLGGSSGYSLLNYLHVTPVAADSYTLSVAVSGSGSVTSSPSGLNCPSGTCTASFGNGSTVTLTATPNSGATFSGWGGACGGSATTCTVTMSADRSVTATFTTSSSPPPPSGGIQVNFQPSGATVPSGYVADDGSPYSSSRGYGWTTNRTGSTRERNQQVDQRLDTLAFASPGETGVWHYDLPNGDYVVSLASGDPAYSHGPQRVEVEGTVVIDNLTSAKDAYLTVENVPVTIVDGTLTITLGGSSGYSLLNYLHVTPVAADSPPPPSGGIQVNFQPSGATMPSGYMADDGSPYSSSRGYGWTTNRTGSTRERNQQVDQRLDTLAFASPGETGVWHYDLPNGDYVVSLASGDPAYSHGPQRVEVEGTVVIDNLTSAKDAYLTVENVPVTIVDGTLTITLGGSSGYSLLNYLHVNPM